MSSYKLKARNKETGEIVDVLALDDWFGRHQYGYKPLVDDVTVYNENTFWKHFEGAEE